jgi:lipid-A-disaccharide synthase
VSAAPPGASPAPAPRTRLRDHLRVLGLLATTLLGTVPFLLHLLVSPVATPVARRRLRRLLERPAPRPDDAPPVDAARWAGRTVFVVAGEPSGDRIAARVVAAIRRAAPGARVRGYAGPATEAAGATLDREIVGRAVVGVFGVLGSLGYWWGLCAETLARFRESPPDVLLTVDFPGLNLRLARWARARGIRTVHLVAPQAWGWAPWRVRRVRRAVDRLLVAFPFEAAWFREAGVAATYVGHPLFEAPLPPPRSTDALDAAPGGTLLVELRPGSRSREVARQGPIVVEAAARVAARMPRVRYVARLASAETETAFRSCLGRAGATFPVDVRVGPPAAGEPPVAAALTTSGTSTCELAVDLVPMVVLYRVSWLGRVGAKALVTSPFVAMANLLAGREVVPERLVGRGGGASLAEDLVALLSDPARWSSTRAALGDVRARVAHPGVAERAARAALG